MGTLPREGDEDVGVGARGQVRPLLSEDQALEKAKGSQWPVSLPAPSWLGREAA